MKGKNHQFILLNPCVYEFIYEMLMWIHGIYESTFHSCVSEFFNEFTSIWTHSPEFMSQISWLWIYINMIWIHYLNQIELNILFAWLRIKCFEFITHISGIIIHDFMYQTLQSSTIYWTFTFIRLFYTHSQLSKVLLTVLSMSEGTCFHGIMVIILKLLFECAGGAGHSFLLFCLFLRTNDWQQGR